MPHYEDVWGSGGIATPFLTSKLVGNECFKKVILKKHIF
jgi:hypothetical protein